jgi:hypothetical protein
VENGSLAQALYNASVCAPSLPVAELVREAQKLCGLVKACSLVFGWHDRAGMTLRLDDARGVGASAEVNIELPDTDAA